MERNIRSVGLVNALILLGSGGVCAFFGRSGGSAAGEVAVVFLGLGFLVALVSYFQMGLEERERLERLEYEELKKARAGTALFTEAADDTFPARRSREQFERFLVPAFTIVLLVLQGLAAWWFWGRATQALPPAAETLTLTMTMFAFPALFLFMPGKYSVRLAQLEGRRLLRSSSAYMMLGAVACFGVALAQVVAWLGFPKVDRILAHLFCIVLGLTAAENLFSLVFEIYRPRVRGQEARLLYESRLIGLLGQPGGLITTAAQALDYQFGFKVSETWFYRMLAEELPLAALGLMAAMFLSTTVVVIEPYEQGVLERMGRPVAGRPVLDPGFHLKWPWPIDQVYRYPSRVVQMFNIGIVPDPDLEKLDVILWTKPHVKEEFHMLVASAEAGAGTESGEQSVPVNLLTVRVPVFFQITNVLQWATNHVDPAATLEVMGNRELVRYLVNVDIDHIMAAGRLDAGDDLKARIQSRANEMQFGVQITFVGLEDIHPPVKVAPDYEAVVGSLQDRETNILAALAYAAEKLPQASAEATNLVSQAQIERLTKVVTAEAESTQFRSQQAAWNASPEVYRQRTYLETLVRGAGPPRKYVLSVTNSQDVILLNLEDKLRPDLLDVPVAPVPGRK